LDESGSPDVRAQPPCLLRYSPSLFAQEAPEVFDYDPTTNCLSLKPGQPPPWLRQNVGQGDPNVWLYCEDCFTQHVGPGDRRRSAGGVPFRDKASQCMLRPTWRSQQRREEATEASAAQATEEAAAEAAVEFGLDYGQEEDQEEGGDAAAEVFGEFGANRDGAAKEPESDPEGEPEGAPDSLRREPQGAKAKKAGDGVDDHSSEEDGSADDDALPGTAASEAGLPVLLHEPRPSIEQYRERWARSLAQHSKPVEGGFSNDNLVPLAIHVLWQDCPYVAFSELKSEEAQARLSVCKPISGLQESCRVGGVERYAHNAGDVSRGHRYKSVQCLGVPPTLIRTRARVRRFTRLRRKSTQSHRSDSELQSQIARLISRRAHPGNSPVLWDSFSTGRAANSSG